MTSIRDFVAAIQDHDRYDDPDKGTVRVFADWLDELGDDRAAEVRAIIAKDSVGLEDAVISLFMPEQLRDYDWKEAFGYSGEAGAYGTGSPERALPNDADTSIEPFGRIDVKRVVACVEGENEGPDWLCVGELHDGRFFALSAGT